ncbi:MAG: GNAT family N-acetyltransferase [Lachnospiraceae bacterium]|nr:GNAT family N-acetyltransferase [Lachnospiraceae bacterium]
MEIRELGASDDRGAVSRIYEKSWKAAYKGIVPQDYLDGIKPGRWAKNLDIPGWTNMVCIENGEFIGTSTYSKSRWDKWPDAGEVISIYLLPEYYGKGYGRPLLTATLNKLKEQGYTEVLLWVLEENSRARRFYERFGFTCTEDTMDGVIGGKTLREVRYVYKFA